MDEFFIKWVSILRTAKGNRAAKVGVAVVIVLIAGLLTLPPLILNVVGVSQVRMVMQMENSHALVNDELVQMTDGNGATVGIYNQSGRTMAPLRWLTENLGLTVAWDNDTQTITLTSDSKKAAVVTLAIGQNSMTIGEETAALDAPAMLVNGVTYVPVRAISEAFGWNLAFVDAKEGALIFVDNKKKAVEPSEEDIAQALELLGPSRAQVLAEGMVARINSDYVLTGDGTIQLTNEGDSVALIRHEEDEDIWVPAQSVASLFGANVQNSGTDYSMLLASGDEITIGTLEENSTAATADAVSNVSSPSTDAAAEDVRMEDGVLYITATKLSQVLGIHETQLSEDVIAFTTLSLTGFSDQQAYLQKDGAVLPDRVIIPKADAYVALTFDDGPTGGANGLTVKLLNGLQERGVHATFFMCGYRINDFHTHMARYLEEGHQLGNHTYNHPGVLTKKTADTVYKEFTDNGLLIQSYCGEQPTVGRPVGGAYNDMVLEQMRKANLAVINWSIDTQDWKYRDAEHVKNVIVSQAKDGDIVLMHDLYATTVQGVLEAIDILQKQNYAFVTVDELAQIKGVTLEPGNVYLSFQ